MNAVDSSGWIEYLSGGSNARFFRRPIESEEPLIVPSLSLFEVYRDMLRHVGREEALNVVAAMRGGRVVHLDDRLALEAAEFVAPEPLVARAAADVMTPAKLGVGEPAALSFQHESLPFGHGIGLQPRHRQLQHAGIEAAR